MYSIFLFFLSITYFLVFQKDYILIKNLLGSFLIYKKLVGNHFVVILLLYKLNNLPTYIITYLNSFIFLPSILILLTKCLLMYS